MIPPSRQPAGLPEWRGLILDRALWTAALLGPLAYLPSVWLSWRERLWSLVILDTVAYAGMVLMALQRRWPPTLRASTLVAVAFALAVVLIPTTGIHGAGLVWVAAVPVLGSVLIGLRAALLCLGGMALLVLVLLLGPWIPGAPPGSPQRLGWTISACNALFLGGILAMGVAVLLRGLEDTHRRLLREIEEHRRAEADRIQLERELLRSQSLESIGTLAGGIAHDLKNILNPILTLTELVQQDLPEGSPGWRRLEDVLAAAERGRELAQRVVAYGRPRPTQRGRVRVASVLEEVASLLRPSPDAVPVEVTCEEPFAEVAADPVELHQVLLNLGTNALHAMAGRAGKVRLVARKDGAEGIAILVEDAGRGMDEATLKRAFDPFFTTKGNGQGSGLGLPTARRIVETLGGTLELHSEAGRGTRAEVRLPVADPNPP